MRFQIRRRNDIMLIDPLREKIDLHGFELELFLLVDCRFDGFGHSVWQVAWLSGCQVALRQPSNSATLATYRYSHTRNNDTNCCASIGLVM